MGLLLDFRHKLFSYAPEVRAHLDNIPTGTHWRKKDARDTLTTKRSRRLKAFLQKEPG